MRAYADSPVHWMTWGDEAFARAKAGTKPVYLLLGSFTSELARAMREQSFARAENAALLNDNFVCIVVDRDDRPDLAAFYQTYLTVVKQTQGSPYSIWLTPELKPFDGASYLPPSDEWGKEGFTNATKRVLAAWQADPEAQRRKGEEAITAMESAGAPSTTPPAMDPAAIKQLLDDSAAGWRGTYDADNGGFGDAPKHPQPELLRFMLHADDASRDAALATLRKLAGSAIRDPLDGGFFRYATDTAWKLPYFQKTLSGQARLALAYLDAAKVAGDPALAKPARDALTFALTLGDPQHGYIAATDGTPESVMPSFFWTAQEIRDVLGGAEAEAFLKATGATAAGNLASDAYLGIDATSKNVLMHPGAFENKEAAERFTHAASRLLEARQKRPAPWRDDIAPSGDHGLLLSALARAGAELPDPKLAAAAKDLVAYVRDYLRASDGTLLARAGRATPASPRDYALVIDGLLAYHATSGDAAANDLAQELLQKLLANYADDTSGRFFATMANASPALPIRVVAPPPEGHDLPGTSSAVLLTLASQRTGDAKQLQALTSRIAADINDSPNQPRGDQLLALQAFAHQP